jgi:hypothetical protein
LEKAMKVFNRRKFVRAFVGVVNGIGVRGKGMVIYIPVVGGEVSE